jgi:PAT family beta-lactamase induction signal transducer AmpG
LSITLAAHVGWPFVNAMLACLYLPMLVVTWLAPEPEHTQTAPATLRDAIWHPFLGFLTRHRALEILAFVVLYKLADNLAGALLRPFLVDMGYSADDRGVALGTVGLAATLGGTFLGGAMTTRLGLGHALWVFGVLQIVSNLGYVAVASSPVDRPLMYGAIGFEQLTSGMGTGAFSVLLLRLTQRRFSATQFALFSSLFGLPRVFAGPVSGFLVAVIGWRDFFWFTIACGAPGLVFLARFVPPGTREPEFTVEDHAPGEPLSATAIALRGVVGFLVAIGTATGVLAFLASMKSGTFLEAVAATARPSDVQDWLQLVAIMIFGLVTGLLVAATAAARHGAVPDAAS